MGRFDLRVDNGEFVAYVLSDTQLLFIRMNGNHAIPRLEAFMKREFDRIPLSCEKVDEFLEQNQEYKKEVARDFIQQWFIVNANNMNEAQFIRRVAEFFRVNRALESYMSAGGSRRYAIILYKRYAKE